MTLQSFNPQDHFFKKAKEHSFVARSIYKLEEIDQRFKLFENTTKKVLDIGCSPWSRLQYAYQRAHKIKWFQAIGLDIQDVKVNLDWVHTYVVDATDKEACRKIIEEENKIEKFDLILSDLAPNTIGFKDIDAMRCIGILEDTLWLYETYLKQGAKFAMKIFMGPGFEEFVSNCKRTRGATNVKLFKPKACRDISKEIYIVKRR